MGIDLSALLRGVTQARGNYLEGESVARKSSEDDLLKRAMLAHQLQQEEGKNNLARALNAANVGHLNAETAHNNAQTTALQNPPPPRDRVAEALAIRKNDILNPLPVNTPPDREVLPVIRNGKRIYAPRAEAVGQEAPAPAEPRDSFTPVTLGGGDGQPAVVKPFNTRTGQTGQAIGDAKPPVTRIESAMNTAAKARLEAAVSEMNNAHSNMTEYEQALASGKANISGLSQFLGATANSFTHDDPASRLIQSQSLAILNRTNPDLARYIRRGLSFAEGESMVSQRPSDFRTKMAAFLSTAASGAKPEMIHDIQGRRTSILNPLNRTVSPAPTTKPNPDDKPGNIDLGNDPEAAWAAKNPPRAGESFDAYHARYLKSQGGD